MKKLKIISLLLVMAMIMTMLTGCGQKPNEAFLEIADEMQSISSGEVSMMLTIKADKSLATNALDEVNEENDLGVESYDMLMDEDGNLNVSFAIIGGFNKDKKEADLDITLFGQKMNAIITEKYTYLDIDGFFNILEQVLGSQVYFVKAFLGDYKYIKLNTSSSDSDEETNTLNITDLPDIDLKKYVTDKSVTKDKATFTATFGPDFVKELTKDMDDFDAVNFDKEFSNSSATVSLSKDSKEKVYSVSVIINLENQVTISLDFKLAESAFSVVLPDEATILDPDNIGNSLGFGSSDNDDDDWDWDDDDYDYTDWDDDWDDDDDWSFTGDDDWDYMLELDYEPIRNSNALLSFVYSETFNDNLEGHLDEYYEKAIAELANHYGCLPSDIKASKYIDQDWGTYSATLEYDAGMLNIAYDIYLTDDHSSLSVSYSFDSLISSTADYIIYDLGSTFGVDMTEDQLANFYDKLNNITTNNSYRNLYSYFEDGSFNFYRWDLMNTGGQYELEYKINLYNF